MFKKINIQTYHRTDFIDITNYIDELLLESNLTEGEVDIFVPHTTCGITTVSYTHLTLPTKA